MYKKKHGALLYHIIIFVGAQFAWFLLLGLWIYWYVTNYIMLNEVGDKLSPQTISITTINLTALISGIVLLMMLSLGMSLIFIYLNRQMNITRLYDDFISNVTHELKSPLSSIQLFLETMRKRNVNKTKQKEFTTNMLKDVERLNQLINSILYISSFQRKKLVRKLAHDYHIYHADSIIREVVQEVIEEYRISNDIVKIEGSAFCQCVIDKNWLKIVFSNLIDNAIKYSPEQLQIMINLSLGIKNFNIEFSDQGVGIAFINQKKIFNKFQRIDNPKSPNVKGTGLGLYWVKEIIEYHGGKIFVKSTGNKVGTTFKITLPIFKTTKKRYINRLLRLSRKNKTEMDNTNE
ncbi:MAG: HAMP domain-containing histidine kinase [Calditrichia bacterium]|nr:HAMP domain-containing histidine kinase [Calditrichia bacterium]